MVESDASRLTRLLNARVFFDASQATQSTSPSCHPGMPQDGRGQQPAPSIFMPKSSMNSSAALGAGRGTLPSKRPREQTPPPSQPNFTSRADPAAAVILKTPENMLIPRFAGPPASTAASNAATSSAGEVRKMDGE
jgi:hypothetical protein